MNDMMIHRFTGFGFFREFTETKQDKKGAQLHFDRHCAKNALQRNSGQADEASPNLKGFTCMTRSKNKTKMGKKMGEEK